METDAVIGKLYRELMSAQQANALLSEMVRGLKDGTLSTDRIVFTEAGITILPLESLHED